jgi:hypothetical protein
MKEIVFDSHETVLLEDIKVNAVVGATVQGTKYVLINLDNLWAFQDMTSPNSGAIGSFDSREKLFETSRKYKTKMFLFKNKLELFQWMIE